MSSFLQQELSSATSSGEKNGKIARRRKVRFNLEVAQSVADQISDLQTRSHSDTKTDVIRKALALLHLVVEETEAGTSIVFRRKNGREEVLKILL